MHLIDIGINLTHASYDPDRDAVIARAAAAGVSQMVVTGATVTGSQQAIALARQHPGVLYATAGVHPHHASALDATALRQLRDLMAVPEVVALGECGLDYFRDLAPRERQREALVAQLALAADCGKPVFLHQRDAHADFLAILREWRPRLSQAVAHCFTDTREAARDYLDLGLHIGITGWICDERRGQHLRTVVPYIPAGYLMLETDSPYLLPRDLHPMPSNRRNEPAFLPHIASAVAACRGETLATLAAHSTAAAREFFRLI